MTRSFFSLPGAVMYPFVYICIRRRQDQSCTDPLEACNAREALPGAPGRRRGLRPQVKRAACGGRRDLEGRLQLRYAGGDHLVDLRVAVRGVVMEWHHVSDAGKLSEPQRVFHRAVSPTGARGVLLGRVLCIVNEQVRACRQRISGRPFGAIGKGWHAESRLVLGEIRNDRFAGLDAVTDGRTGMTDQRRGETKRADFDLTA